MRKNPLKYTLALITGIAYAILFGALVGGNDPATVWTIATLSFVGGIVLSYGYSPRDRRAMAYTCGAITSGITLNCDDPLEAGVKATFYIANKDDIASITYDPANPMLAEAITMAAGKNFYEIQGQLQSTEPNFVMVKGKYVNNFEHTVSFLVFKIDPATKKEINNMKDGNFVCIVQNNYIGNTIPGNSKYELYGAGAGLKADVLERNPADAETLGAFKVTLKTQEYAREAKPPVTFFDTDLVTTDAAIAALL